MLYLHNHYGEPIGEISRFFAGRFFEGLRNISEAARPMICSSSLPTNPSIIFS
jgi:hypothetical protein